MDLSTRLLHADDEHPRPNEAGVYTASELNGPVAPSISVSTTFRWPGPLQPPLPEGDIDPSASNPLVYSRYSTPSSERVEKVLDSLMGARTVLYSSGLAASFAAMLWANPTVIAIREGYHGSHMAIDVFKRIKSNLILIDLDDFDAYTNETLCWLETPLNPTGEARDMAHYAKHCKAKGAKLLVDSTFAPPPLQDPFRHGADIVMHSATKYLNGHSDALLGVLAVKSQSDWERLWSDRTFTGPMPGSLECWLLLRSLRTLSLRVKRQAKTATGLAHWLNTLTQDKASLVNQVWHASLQAKQGQFDAFAAQQLTGGPACFSILLSSAEVAKWLPYTVKLFAPATSLGGVESLMEHRITSDAKADPKLVRISVGLEDLEDLKADILTALNEFNTTLDEVKPSTSESDAQTIVPVKRPATDASDVANASEAKKFKSTGKGKQPAIEPYRAEHRIIRAGEPFLISLPSGLSKLIPKLSSGVSINLGKYGQFKSDDLIGRPYGFTYEITHGGSLTVVQHVTLSEIEERERENTNEDIMPQTYVGLSAEQVAELRAADMTGKEIVDYQIAVHAEFDKKNRFSQEKYRRRKETKYLKMFTPVAPTLYNICAYHFVKDPPRFRDLRVDSMAQILNLADVRPHKRVLLIDDTAGALAAGCVERMDGHGALVLIHDASSDIQLPVCDYMGFSVRQKSVICQINWAATDPTHQPFELPTDVDIKKDTRDRGRQKAVKRQAQYEANAQMRQQFFDGGFGCVIIATAYDPLDVLSRVSDKLAGSAQVVIYSPSLEPLASASRLLRGDPQFIGIGVHQPFLRKYQVLPGRTHPEMTGLPAGGYILTAISVLAKRKDENGTRKSTPEQIQEIGQNAAREQDAMQDKMQS
ncbi:uncharacterized protein L969DRAFT_94895 [Mixia osmundae IAM 14324]|uniref:tRNA (adenine(58)-N(1))-methyltransferase non-catalytic subunit TRM6 n=1 Tax=Mixia osmundae (strain CBS 9802 / IAM 14324 / JCM 22182 / KY 12970) TaxID=764103 RepID=G7E203_MIXOS|nr:uncharacterized protein L969DRAFT_94895 [Mixia osmundae IAM 14324]KEI38701.1 hypothetical protein L969DRAFT_94895 [Mixia osmundae IAM 14324]GAA96840.1 hypothetical protein E5Q_03513 [Mixia osmundae IAM 14324]